METGLSPVNFSDLQLPSSKLHKKFTLADKKNYLNRFGASTQSDSPQLYMISKNHSPTYVRKLKVTQIVSSTLGQIKKPYKHILSTPKFQVVHNPRAPVDR